MSYEPPSSRIKWTTRSKYVKLKDHMDSGENASQDKDPFNIVRILGGSSHLVDIAPTYPTYNQGCNPLTKWNEPPRYRISILGWYPWNPWWNFVTLDDPESWTLGNISIKKSWLNQRTQTMAIFKFANCWFTRGDSEIFRMMGSNLLILSQSQPEMGVIAVDLCILEARSVDPSLRSCQMLRIALPKLKKKTGNLHVTFPCCVDESW